MSNSAGTSSNDAAPSASATGTSTSKDDPLYPGPYCKAAGVKKEHIVNHSVVCVQENVFKNGVLFELAGFLKRNSVPKGEIVNLTLKLGGREDYDTSYKETLRKNIDYLLKKRQNSRSKKELDSIQYSFPRPTNSVLIPLVQNESDSNVGSFATEEPMEVTFEGEQSSNSLLTPAALQDPESHPSTYITVPQDFDHLVPVRRTRPSKFSKTKCQCVQDHLRINYETARNEKYLNKLRVKIDDLKVEIKAYVGHYSKLNVDRRDNRAKSNSKELKNLRRSYGDAQETVERLQGENERLLLRIEQLEKSLSDKEKNITDMSKKLQVTKGKNQKLKNSRTYYRSKGYGKYEIVKNKKAQETVRSLKDRVIELETSISEPEEHVLQYPVLKDSNGFSSRMRTCVLGLLGLEIAQAKIPLTIQWVAEAMYDHQIKDIDLPSRSLVQNISDESHYIAKRYISEQLDSCENWGLAKDGTSRRKVKILDTSLTLSSGDCISLGFTRVASETGVAITEVAKRALAELDDVHSESDHADNSPPENFMVTALEKFTFTMGDRASNEKKADQLLDEWRKEILTAAGSPAAQQSIHNFHCMAHVLLGFHSYTKPSLFEYEKELVISHGKFGRDALGRFATWKKEEAASRATRTTAELFGPVGDHIGVRDAWESYCARRGIKSIIGNYRDNRFNCYFEIAAQICLHREDFITVLKLPGQLKDANGKKVSVLADLTCPIVTTIQQALGLMYVLITGPYWKLLLGGQVVYMELYKIIQPLYAFLKQCVDDPSPLLHGESPFPEEYLQVSEAMKRSVSLLQNENMDDIFKEVLKKSSAAFVKTFEAQLKDFLEGGVYGTAPAASDLQHTKFSGLTNLACEHHFGDLDSSQKRRPSATLFYHSTIQLLKRNRKKIINWMGKMSAEDKEKLWGNARCKANNLKQRHREMEKQEMEKVLATLEQQPAPKRQRKPTGSGSSKKQSKPCPTQDTSDDSDDEAENSMPSPSKTQLDEKLEKVRQQIAVGKWVIVAFDDDWYPGLVEKQKSPTEWVVDFGHKCKTLGDYRKPDGRDVQLVEDLFVLDVDFNPVPTSNDGRLWKVPGAKEVTHLYEHYAATYLSGSNDF